jgi:pimeloyl-ACP methyl ester carboxylesterase
VTVTARTPSGIAYESAGSGPAVLLLHAGLTDRRMWEPQWPALTRHFNAIRFDARGFGNSSDPKRPYTLHDDALEVLDALEVDRAALVGASMGGSAALDLALARPERAAALVTIASTPSGWSHSADLIRAWDAVEDAYERRGAEAANELEMRMWLDGPYRRPEAVDRDVRLSIASVNHVLLERQSRFPAEPDELDPPAIGRLEELAVPSLVVTGELDQPSVIAGAFEIARRTGAEHEEIPDAAHLPNLERPDEFERSLLEFLQRTISAEG